MASASHNQTPIAEGANASSAQQQESQPASNVPAASNTKQSPGPPVVHNSASMNAVSSVQMKQDSTAPVTQAQTAAPTSASAGNKIPSSNQVSPVVAPQQTASATQDASSASSITSAMQMPATLQSGGRGTAITSSAMQNRVLSPKQGSPSGAPTAGVPARSSTVAAVGARPSSSSPSGRLEGSSQNANGASAGRGTVINRQQGMGNAGRGRSTVTSTGVAVTTAGVSYVASPYSSPAISPSRDGGMQQVQFKQMPASAASTPRNGTTSSVSTSPGQAQVYRQSPIGQAGQGRVQGQQPVVYTSSPMASPSGGRGTTVTGGQSVGRGYTSVAGSGYPQVVYSNARASPSYAPTGRAGTIPSTASSPSVSPRGAGPYVVHGQQVMAGARGSVAVRPASSPSAVSQARAVGARASPVYSTASQAQIYRGVQYGAGSRSNPASPRGASPGRTKAVPFPATGGTGSRPVSPRTATSGRATASPPRGSHVSKQGSPPRKVAFSVAKRSDAFQRKKLIEFRKAAGRGQRRQTIDSEGEKKKTVTTVSPSRPIPEMIPEGPAIFEEYTTWKHKIKQHHQVPTDNVDKDIHTYAKALVEQYAKKKPQPHEEGFFTCMAYHQAVSMVRNSVDKRFSGIVFAVNKVESTSTAKRSTRSFLEALDDGVLTGEIEELLKVCNESPEHCATKYYEGSIIVELRDYRFASRKSNKPDIKRVILKPDLNCIVHGLSSLLEETGRAEFVSISEELELEGKVLAAVKPVCLDPNPQGLRRMIATSQRYKPYFDRRTRLPFSIVMRRHGLATRGIIRSKTESPKAGVIDKTSKDGKEVPAKIPQFRGIEVFPDTFSQVPVPPPPYAPSYVSQPSEEAMRKRSLQHILPDEVQHLVYSIKKAKLNKANDFIQYCGPVEGYGIPHKTMVKYKKLKMQQTPVNLKLGPNEKVPEVDSMRSPIPYKREVKMEHEVGGKTSAVIFTIAPNRYTPSTQSRTKAIDEGCYYSVDVDFGTEKKRYNAGNFQAAFSYFNQCITFCLQDGFHVVHDSAKARQVQAGAARNRAQPAARSTTPDSSGSSASASKQSRKKATPSSKMKRSVASPTSSAADQYKASQAQSIGSASSHLARPVGSAAYLPGQPLARHPGGQAYGRPSASTPSMSHQMAAQHAAARKISPSARAAVPSHAIPYQGQPAEARARQAAASATYGRPTSQPVPRAGSPLASQSSAAAQQQAAAARAKATTAASNAGGRGVAHSSATAVPGGQRLVAGSAASPSPLQQQQQQQQNTAMVGRGGGVARPTASTAMPANTNAVSSGYVASQRVQRPGPSGVASATAPGIARGSSTQGYTGPRAFQQAAPARQATSNLSTGRGRGTIQGVPVAQPMGQNHPISQQSQPQVQQSRSQSVTSSTSIQGTPQGQMPRAKAVAVSEGPRPQATVASSPRDQVQTGGSPQDDGK